MSNMDIQPAPNDQTQLSANWSNPFCSSQQRSPFMLSKLLLPRVCNSEQLISHQQETNSQDNTQQQNPCNISIDNIVMQQEQQQQQQDTGQQPQQMFFTNIIEAEVSHHSQQQQSSIFANTGLGMNHKSSDGALDTYNKTHFLAEQQEKNLKQSIFALNQKKKNKLSSEECGGTLFQQNILDEQHPPTVDFGQPSNLFQQGQNHFETGSEHQEDVMLPGVNRLQDSGKGGSNFISNIKRLNSLTYSNLSNNNAGSLSCRNSFSNHCQNGGSSGGGSNIFSLHMQQEVKPFSTTSLQYQKGQQTMPSENANSSFLQFLETDQQKQYNHQQQSQQQQLFGQQQQQQLSSSQRNIKQHQSDNKNLFFGENSNRNQMMDPDYEKKKKSRSAVYFPCKMHSIQEKRQMQQQAFDNVSKWLIKKISPYMQCNSNRTLPPSEELKKNYNYKGNSEMPSSMPFLPPPPQQGPGMFPGTINEAPDSNANNFFLLDNAQLYQKSYMGGGSQELYQQQQQQQYQQQQQMPQQQANYNNNQQQGQYQKEGQKSKFQQRHSQMSCGNSSNSNSLYNQPIGGGGQGRDESGQHVSRQGIIERMKGMGEKQNSMTSIENASSKENMDDCNSDISPTNEVNSLDKGNPHCNLSQLSQQTQQIFQQAQLLQKQHQDLQYQQQMQVSQQQQQEQEQDQQLLQQQQQFIEQ